MTSVCVCVCVCVCGWVGVWVWVRERERWVGEESRRTSPSSVFSTRPFTMRANSWSLSFVSLAEMMGVLMVLAAFIISLILGTPSVMSEGLRVKATYMAHRERWE